MQTIFEIDCERKIPKYLQIVHSVTKSIRFGKLKKGDRILSINELSNEFFLSRDTVQKAYGLLEQDGIILPVKGKGFYINRTDINKSYRILLLFNKMSNYKKLIYNSFVHSMGNKATVDLKIYHSNTTIFEQLVNAHLGEYDYYVIMPHFYENIEVAFDVMKKIPAEQVVILDKNPGNMPAGYAAVFQDFKSDIITALETGISLIRKYKKITLVFPKAIPYPVEIEIGFRVFCQQHDLHYTVINEIAPDRHISAGEAFIVIEETDLVNLIKISRVNQLTIGEQIGIISYNETPLKEILLDGITVISTDHEKMGETAAKLILSNSKEKIKNPFALIRRKSL